MPNLRIDPDLEMTYPVDDYTDPWRNPETILLLQGVQTAVRRGSAGCPISRVVFVSP